MFTLGYLVMSVLLICVYPWVSSDVSVAHLCLFIFVMIAWVSGDVCFIVTGGNVFCCCYDWLDKW